jgi:hypothetical protein
VSAMKTVTINVELTDAEAWQFAQFLKRAGFSDYRTNASNDDEAYVMRDAGGKIQDALAKQGYSPR